MSRDPSIKRVPPAARPPAAAAPNRSAPQSPRPQPQPKVSQVRSSANAAPVSAPPATRIFYGTAIARGLALFLAIFSLLNIAIEHRQLGYNANQWWINFNPLYAVLGKLILLWIAI